ncbi:MAG: protein translocase subunit SecD [Ignavibacteria bacterium]|nr:protein translocase subunit SecD [Ignavibacteria bacterium]
MKELRFRFILIVLAIALSIYLLYPTYVDYQNSKDIQKIVQAKRSELLINNPSYSEDQLNKVLLSIEDSIKLADPSIREARLKRVKLGLDLQGGMRVVLEVNTVKLLEKIANNPDDDFTQVLESAAKEAAISDEAIVDIFARKLEEKQIRLSRYFGSIREDDAKILSDLRTQTDDAVTRAMEIIRNRVDQYGVSEPSIQKQGERRVIIELPGIAKEEEARQLLQGTALLEFRLLKDPEFTINVMKKIDETLAGKTIEETDSALVNDSTKLAADTTSQTDTTADQQLSAEEFAKQHPFFAIALINPQGQSADAYVKADDKVKVQRMLNRTDVQKVIPNNVEFAFSAKPIGIQEGQDIFVLYLVNKNPELTGGVITDAMANIDPSTSAAIVSMEMNSEGATEWARITGANIDKRCAIMLDGVIFSAPVIRGKIPGGRSQIEGMANLEEAKLLEIVLKAGALPAPVEIIEERTVGPSLGQDSISKGLNSAILGYVLVAIFMVIYYRKAGTVAAAALTFTIVFIMGILAGFGATLTLPGIAGVVLTMGMAVDANVLIYERIREELATGKTAKASIDGGFSKAYSAIFDSNITTFFTGIILYQFGSGPVQGFALTLMIGIVASLFSALVIGRLLFDFMLVKGQKISLG